MISHVSCNGSKKVFEHGGGEEGFFAENIPEKVLSNLPGQEPPASPPASLTFIKFPICGCCFQSLYQVSLQPPHFPPTPFNGAFKQTMHQFLPLCCQHFTKQHTSRLPPSLPPGQNVQASLATPFSLTGQSTQGW